MRTAFLIFLLLSLGRINAQVCDSIYPDDPAKLEKTAGNFKEKISKGKKVTKDAFLCFEIAQYLRRKGDTIAVQLYSYATNLFKTAYGKEKDAVKKSELLYKIGLCYFYYSDIKSAETYLAKSVKAKYFSPCKYYYLYLCKKAQGRKEEADIELQNFNKERGN